MEATQFTSIYDSLWFGMETPNNSFAPPDSPTLASMYLRVQRQQEVRDLPPPARRRSSQSKIPRSVSEDFSSKEAIFGSASPDSVLSSIISGKEFTSSAEELVIFSPPPPLLPKPSKTAQGRRRVKKESAGAASKSMTSLEFEELKGFMDLGFVFSEKDKDSSLVSILPGLQRLGKEGGEGEEENSAEVPRPYLSEAWAVREAERRKMKKAAAAPVTNWRAPARGSEVDMKDSLRLWAQTVASTVR